jgi:hypothetical protein
MDRRTARFGLVTLLPGLFALLVTGCGGAASAARPIPNRQPAAAAPTTTSTTTPESPEAAVRRTYLQSWDDYAHATRTLDTEGLERTYADQGLKIVDDEIDQRVHERRRARVSVSHDLTIVIISPDHAAVADNVADSSVDVDADTGADLEGSHTDHYYFQTTLQRLDGRWKVVFYT